jgi:predicted negative regulator of RcsB-dependent stress response
VALQGDALSALGRRAEARAAYDRALAADSACARAASGLRRLASAP